MHFVWIDLLSQQALCSFSKPHSAMVNLRFAALNRTALSFLQIEGLASNSLRKTRFFGLCSAAFVVRPFRNIRRIPTSSLALNRCGTMLIPCASSSSSATAAMQTAPQPQQRRSPMPLYFNANAAAAPHSVPDVKASKSETALNAFLDAAQAHLDSLSPVTANQSSDELIRKSSTRTVFVMGNEASDMDSIISSIVVAYYEQLLHDAANSKSATPATKVQFVPLLNIPRCELRLRGESKLILETVCGIDIRHQLMFKNDPQVIPLLRHAALEPQSDLVQFILTDHNKLSPSQQQFAPHVIGVLDHHADDKMYLDTCGAANHFVAPIGSCCSHVVNLIVRNSHLSVLNLSMCELLWSAILLDTSNFNTEQNKATAGDLMARDALVQRMCKVKFRAYKDARIDVSELTTCEILQKDVKYFACECSHNNVTQSVSTQISSVPLNVTNWLEKDAVLWVNLSRAAVEAQQRGQAQALLVMSSSTRNAKQEFKRQLLVVVPQQAASSAAAPFVLSGESLCFALECTDLQLLPIEIDISGASAQGCFIRAYQQRNQSFDRKKVAPLVQQVISKL